MSKTYSTTIEITEEKEYSVTINTGLNLSAWIAAGSTTGYPLNPSSYANFSALEADEKAVRQLMTVHASVDYLATARAGDSLMSSIINSNVCAKWINLRDYAYDTLSANANIKSVMDTADKYGYGEWGKINSTTWGPLGNVPIMTANNAPYGTALRSGKWSTGNYEAWMAFDGNNSDRWVSASNTPGQWIGYEFVNLIKPKRVHLKMEVLFESGYVQGSNSSDFSNPDTLYTFSNLSGTEIDFEIPDTAGYYKCWRVYCTNSGGGYQGNYKCYALQFYGRELKPLVPTMTANNKPKGKVIADEPDSANQQAYRAFDNNSSTKWCGGNTVNSTYIGYLFDKEQKVQFIAGKMGSCTTASCTKTFKFQYLNGSLWSDISNGSRTVKTSSDTSVIFTPVICNVSTTGIRAFLTSTSTTARMQSHELKFYGMDYSEKEFAQGSTRKTIYDHGVAPSGAITGGTKNPDCLTLSAVGTATVTIDKGTRKYMGGKAGLHASGTNRLKCGSGYSAFTASNMPDSNGFDISSISGSVAVGIEQTASGTFDCTEIWIE